MDSEKLGIPRATVTELMEAAMCAWEHLLENPDMEPLGGYASARYKCGEIAEAVHIGYEIANADYRLDGYSFDWEFVPWFMDTCVILGDDQTSPTLVVDWIERCRRLEFK